MARYNPLFRKPGPDGVNLLIEHPLEPIRRGLAWMAEQKVDRVVLLAALHREDARRILQEISGIDFIVGSYGGVASTQSQSEALVHREAWPRPGAKRRRRGNADVKHWFI